MLCLLNLFLTLTSEKKQNCLQVNSYTANIKNIASLSNVKENE